MSLNKLLQDSDVINLNCNVLSDTTLLRNEAVFAEMKRKPVIINTARGEVIKDNALFQALNNDTIHCAGLDVYENEPVSECQERLNNHPPTICMGYQPWYFERAAKELQKRAALHLCNLLKGEEVEDCLNP